MDDERLEAIARRLGADAEQRVDADRVARRVLDRLRREPGEAVAPTRWGVGGWTRIAVAAALVAAVGLGVMQRFGDRTVSQEEPVATPAGLAELVPGELAEIIDSLAVEAPVAELVIGLEDLSEEQLETLLRRLEG